MALFLFASKSHASGCNPHDLRLASEVSVVSLGVQEAAYRCQDSQCRIDIYRKLDGIPEAHSLVQADKAPASANTTLPDLEVKIYRQYFMGSCEETVRYVIGTEYNGIRYRSEADISY